VQVSDEVLRTLDANFALFFGAANDFSAAEMRNFDLKLVGN